MFIPKPGRASYDQASSYRPISLTSFVLKTLERMCDRYIRDVTLKLKPLHKNQHAYQAGKSVDSALHQVVFNVEKSMESGGKTLATFLDLEGAFNKVTFRAINAVDHGCVEQQNFVNRLIRRSKNRPSRQRLSTRRSAPTDPLEHDRRQFDRKAERSRLSSDRLCR